jgi:hypothetical protein
MQDHWDIDDASVNTGEVAGRNDVQGPVQSNSLNYYSNEGPNIVTRSCAVLFVSDSQCFQEYKKWVA